jgi:hypothetical protein
MGRGFGAGVTGDAAVQGMQLLSGEQSEFDAKEAFQSGMMGVAGAAIFTGAMRPAGALKNYLRPAGNEALPKIEGAEERQAAIHEQDGSKPQKPVGSTKYREIKGLVKEGLGKISGNTYKVTRAGIEAIKKHLDIHGMNSPENAAMIQRLEKALQNGQELTGADASFYLHELKESALKQGGVAYDAAHQAALDFYEVSPYSIYHPEVIQRYSEWFNSNWFDFWGIGK